jgi:hypothetical protein
VTSPAEQIRDACYRAGYYYAILQGLLARSVQGAGLPGGGMPGARPAAPLPGNPQAFYAQTDLRETVFRLEITLALAAPGTTIPAHGGSDANLGRALRQIPRLAAALDQDDEAAAARILERRIRAAQCCPAIDEVRRYRLLPSRAATGRPPACPYCGMWWLYARVGDDGRPDGQVECHVPGCADSAGWRPAATMGTDGHGRLCLAWADGRVQVVPDLTDDWAA